jgi:hypothetical protein
MVRPPRRVEGIDATYNAENAIRIPGSVIPNSNGYQ